jgi:hypothetical protein
MTLPTHPLLRKSRIARLIALLTTLLLAIALTPAASAEEALGRLFFTPERRQQLDRQRQLNIKDDKQLNEDPTLTINGVVTRSSGKRTSWVNGAAQNETETPGGLTVRPQGRNPGNVVLQASDSPAANALVGETVNRTTGESRSLLNDGRIVVKRPAAK